MADKREIEWSRVYSTGDIEREKASIDPYPKIASKMLSQKCRVRNEAIIPRLLKDHASVAADPDIIDLRTADNWFMREKLVKTSFLSPSPPILHQDLTYSEDIGGSQELRTRLATLFHERICADTHITSHDIVLGAGASFILDALVEAICDPGDLIMIATPYWSGLDLCISVHNNCSVLEVQVPLDAFFDPRSVEYYEKALLDAKAPVKAILICNPHNPLGGCYRRDTLEAMARFCTSRSIQLISDEVYALSIHGGTAPKLENEPSMFVSALHLPRLPFIHVVYSLSKDFGCNGIRLGALATSNEAIRMSVSLSTHAQLSTLTRHFALSTILTTPILSYQQHNNLSLLRKNYLTLAQFLSKKHVKFYNAQAGFFVFARLCDGDEKAFVDGLRRHGVLLASGTSYHHCKAGWFRICFAVEADVLGRAIRRIGQAMSSHIGKPLRRSGRVKKTQYRLEQAVRA